VRLECNGSVFLVRPVWRTVFSMRDLQVPGEEMGICVGLFVMSVKEKPSRS